METEKEIIRSCLTCRFRESRHAPPPSIERVTICRRFPPIPVVMAGPQGMAQMSAFPLVQAESWCYEWTAEEAANKLITPG